MNRRMTFRRFEKVVQEPPVRPRDGIRESWLDFIYREGCRFRPLRSMAYMARSVRGTYADGRVQVEMPITGVPVVGHVGNS